MIKTTISRITPLNRSAMAECRLRVDNLIKPLNSLGAFEELACQLAGVFGVARPQIPPCSLLLATVGDGRPSAATRVFADHVGATLVCVAAAQSGEEKPDGMQIAMEAGIRAAAEETAKGSRILGLGTVAAQPVDADFLWEGDRSVNAAIAAAAGMVLGAAAARAIVVLDDSVTLAGAWLAVQRSPLAKQYLIGSQRPADAVGAEIVRRLEIKTCLHTEMTMGEGTGAALGISLLKASLHMLNDMRTFGEAEVPVAEDGPGAFVQTKTLRD